MKRKLLTFILAGTLVLSSSTLAFAADTPAQNEPAVETENPADETAPTKETEEVSTETEVPAPETKETTPQVIAYQFVSGKEAVAAMNSSDVLIVDVRSTVNYEKGHLKGSLSLPVFDASNQLPAALQTAFADYVKAHKQDFNKKIYLLCNSGKRGAQTATEVLVKEEIPAENIYTITGGATDADIQAAFTIDYNFVSGETAVAAIGNSDVLIIDVRSAVNYEKGHLAGSLSLPVFDSENGLPDDLAAAFEAYVKANPAAFQKTIYILCNSGSRGAEKATALLKANGIPANQIFTIEGGAKNASIQAEFITTEQENQKPETRPTTKPETKPAAKPTTKPETKPVAKPDQKKAAQTGDATSAIPYVLMMGAALTVMAGKKKFAK